MEITKKTQNKLKLSLNLRKNLPERSDLNRFARVHGFATLSAEICSIYAKSTLKFNLNISMHLIYFEGRCDFCDAHKRLRSTQHVSLQTRHRLRLGRADQVRQSASHRRRRRHRGGLFQVLQREEHASQLGLLQQPLPLQPAAVKRPAALLYVSPLSNAGAGRPFQRRQVDVRPAGVSRRREPLLPQTDSGVCRSRPPNSNRREVAVSRHYRICVWENLIGCIGYKNFDCPGIRAQSRRDDSILRFREELVPRVAMKVRLIAGHDLPLSTRFNLKYD